MNAPEHQDAQGTIARCKPDDLEELLRFRGAVHGASTIFADARHLRWQHQETPSPSQRPLSCWVYRRAGRIEGQIGGTRVGLKAGDRECEALWTLDGAVDPACRGKGIFSALLDPVSAECDLTMATESSPPGKRAMLRAGWIDLGTLDLFVRPLDLRRLIHARGRPALGATLGTFADALLRGFESPALLACGRAKLRLEEVERFDDRADAVWKQSSAFYPVICKRDRAFLEWRFERYPSARFRLLYLHRGSETVGYAVVRIGSRGGLPTSYLVDFLCPPRLLPWLLLLILRFSRDAGMALVCCLHRNPLSTAAFKALGFARRDTGWPLVAKIRSLPAAEETLVRGPNNWFLTGADSDLDRPRPE